MIWSKPWSKPWFVNSNFFCSCSYFLFIIAYISLGSAFRYKTDVLLYINKYNVWKDMEVNRRNFNSRACGKFFLLAMYVVMYYCLITDSIDNYHNLKYYIPLWLPIPLMVFTIKPIRASAPPFLFFSTFDSYKWNGPLGVWKEFILLIESTPKSASRISSRHFF